MEKQEQPLLVQVIRERNYKDIPGWVICMIDDDGFLLLLEDVLNNVIQEDYMIPKDCGKQSILGDVHDVLARIRNIGNVRDSTMYRFLHKLDNGTLLLAALLLESNREWKRYLKNSDVEWFAAYSAFASNDVITALVASYIYHEEMLPTALLDLLFYAWERQMNGGDDMRPVIDAFIQQVAIWQAMNVTPESFVGKLWETIWQYRHRYCWIAPHFSIERCWSYGGWNYYPYAYEDWVYPYLCAMAENNQAKPIPKNVYPHLERFLLNEDYGENKVELENMVYRLIDINANNLLLLRLFRKWYEDDSCLEWFTTSFYAKFQFLRPRACPLVDYHIFYELAGDRGKNHQVQLEFLKQEGNPCSLLDIPHSVIYTIEGICTAIDHSNESHLASIFEEEKIQDIFMEQYLKEGYVPERTFRLINALGHYPKKENERFYYWVRTNLVNLDAVQPRTNTSICRVIPLEFQEVGSILEKCPDAIGDIPFGRIAFRQFLNIIHGKNCYVPLYFGFLPVNGSYIQSATSLESFLNSQQLLDLVLDYPAYLGDIKTETVGIVLLGFLCL